MTLVPNRFWGHLQTTNRSPKPYHIRNLTDLVVDYRHTLDRYRYGTQVHYLYLGEVRKKKVKEEKK